MAEEVDRFDSATVFERGNGDFVRYSDYKKLEAAFEKQTRTAWRLEREVEEASDRIADARDQARNQERQRIQEALAKRAQAMYDEADRQAATDPDVALRIKCEANAIQEAAAALDTLDPSGVLDG